MLQSASHVDTSQAARRAGGRSRVRSASLLILAGVFLAGAAPSAHAQDLPQLFQRVSKSVVIVRAKGRDLVMQGGTSTPVKFNEVGSGVLVSTDGKVLTAAHVVQIADEVTVEILGGETVTARVVGSKVKADLALLQLSRVPAGIQPARLGDSARVQVGEQVFIVGAPYGIAHTLTVGHVSGRHKPNTVYAEIPLAEFLQTDAAINQGNSGGPMFNMRGEVIGIVSHIISKSGGYEGLGFVVSSNMARQLMLDQRPFWSGVTWFRVSGVLAEYLNLPQSFAFLVEEVAKGSPAETLGLRPSGDIAKIGGQDVPLGGDVVLAGMGVQLNDETSFQKMLERWAQLRSGDEITLKVFRAGRIIDLKGRVP